MINYFDASSIAMLALGDHGSERLGAWIAAQPPAAKLAFSDFGWGELVSAVGIRVLQRLLSGAEGHQQLVEARVLTVSWAEVRIVSADIAGAADMVADFGLGLKLPDAIHIAVAHRLSAVFVSADKRQVGIAASRGLSIFNPLDGA